MTDRPREPVDERPADLRPIVAAFLGALAIGAIIVAGSLYESHRQHIQTEEVLRMQGEALVEALGHAVEDTLLAGREIDVLSASRLLDHAHLLSRLDSRRSLGPQELDELAVDLDLARILILDSELRIERSFPAGLAAEAIAPYRESLAAFIDGQADSLVLAPRELPEDGGRRLAAAARRSQRGLLIAEADSRQVLLFDDALGLSHLLDTVAHTGGILEATLLDADGGPLAGALGQTHRAGVPSMILERPVTVEPGRIGTLRIGLSTEPVVAAHEAGLRRSALLAAVLLGLSGAVAATVAAIQRARRVRGESERVRAETDAVLDGLEDGVVVLDDADRIRWINPAAARLCGIGRDAMLGRTCAEASCGLLADAAGVPISTVEEVRIEAADGRSIPLLVSVSPVQDEERRVRGRAIVLRDLSRLKELEAQTRRAESLSALGRLAGTVAHEVRNPLNAIAVGVQRLQREFDPPDRADEYGRLTGIVRSEVGRLDQIVHRFLDFARSPKLSPVAGDLDQVIEEVVALQAQGLPPGVRLEIESAGAPGALFDPTATRQVLLNVIRNAAEAVGERGRIGIATRTAEDQAIVEIRDDGPGLPEDQRDRLFEFGFTTKSDGTGMGLAVVQRLVVEMGGSVELWSSGESEGTVVRIRLPLPEGATGEADR